MNLYLYLQDHTNDILAEAGEGVERAHLKHYEQAGKERVHRRLRALFVLCMRGVKERNLGPMVAHADEIARERFNAGFDLWEVQTAFNVLEETIWKRILKDLPPVEYAEALGLVSTVLGTGKDTLARRYVSLASKSRVPSLNMQSLFTGTEGI
jgi:hypothetical protein